MAKTIIIAENNDGQSFARYIIRWTKRFLSPSLDLCTSVALLASSLGDILPIYIETSVREMHEKESLAQHTLWRESFSILLSLFIQKKNTHRCEYKTKIQISLRCNDNDKRYLNAILQKSYCHFIGSDVFNLLEHCIPVSIWSVFGWWKNAIYSALCMHFAASSDYAFDSLFEM